MGLSQKLEEKKVRIVDIDGETFLGIVSDYIYPEDNEPEGVSAIDIESCPQRSGKSVSFNENEIKSIEVIEGYPDDNLKEKLEMFHNKPIDDIYITSSEEVDVGEPVGDEIW